MKSTTAFKLLLAASAAGVRSAAASAECDAIASTIRSLGATQCGSDTLHDMCASSGGSCPTCQTCQTCNCGDTNTVNNHETSDDPEPNTTDSEPFMGAYYPNWFVYRKHYMGLDKIGVNGDEIDPDQAKEEYVVYPSTVANLLPKLNTLYYAFLDLDDDCFISDFDPDASWYGASSEPTWIPLPKVTNCKGAMNDMLAMKSQYPHLKIVLSIGGWTFSQNYSNCAKQGEAGFKKMYDSFDYYTSGNWGKSGSMYAGLDFDWEHPGAEGLTQDFDASVDWKNYADMVEYFRKRMNSEGRTEAYMTSAVGMGDTLDLLMQQPAIGKRFCDALDHVNLMAYDLHGKWEPTTGHNAPFCQIDTGANARPAPRPLPWAIQPRMAAIGGLCGHDKIALGIPNYTPAWTDIPNTDNGLYQTSTNSENFAGWTTFSDSDKALIPQGIVAYWDLKQALASDSSFKVFSKNCPASDGVTVPIKWVYSSSRRAFACYEDVETVTQKTKWASQNGYAGFFFWDISQDKDGDLLNAARSGWGFSGVHNAAGSASCHDELKPDFSKNPDGGESDYGGCHTGGNTVVVPSGEGCAAAKALAVPNCANGLPIAIGGSHSGSSDCVTACTQGWANGELWAGDTVYYVCKGDSLPSGGNGGNGGTGNVGGGGSPPTTPGGDHKGGPCNSACKTCVRSQAGMDQDLTDAQCQSDCIVSGVTWWPCVLECECKE